MTDYSDEDFFSILQEGYHGPTMVKLIEEDPVEFTNWFHDRVIQYKKDAMTKKVDKSYEYLVTLTLAKEPEPDTVQQVEASIKRYSKSTVLCPSKFYYAMELTKAGRPHWHIYIKCSKPLKSDFWRTHKIKFGTVHQVKITKGTTDNIKKYISKDTIPIKLRG